MDLIVIGAGNAGRPVARIFNHKGHNVVVTDPKTFDEIHPDHQVRLIQMEKEGVVLDLGNLKPNLKGMDAAYLAPTLPKDSDVYKAVIDAGLNIITNDDVGELVNSFINIDIIGITGTMGKTTTTFITESIFKSAGFNVWACSSMNQNLVSEVIIDGIVNGKAEESDIAIFELPHGTAGLFPNLSLKIGIFLNIHEDHLSEFEGSMEKYIQRKMFITKTSETLISSNHLKNIVYLERKDVLFYGWENKDWDSSFCDIIGISGNENITIKYNLNNLNKTLKNKLINNQKSLNGEFSCSFKMMSYFYENATAATSAALVYGINEEYIKKALINFTGLPVHMENIGSYNGREVILDSAFLYEGMRLTMEYFKDKPVVLLLDNFDTTTERDKHEVGKLCGKYVDVIIATGFNEVSQKIEMDAAKAIIDGAKGTDAFCVATGTMEEGAEACIKYSKPGDIILHIGPVIMHDRDRIVRSIISGLEKGCMKYD